VVSSLRFQVSGFKSQVSGFRSQVSGIREFRNLEILEFRMENAECIKNITAEAQRAETN
jgi:hypothetical protein